MTAIHQHNKNIGTRQLLIFCLQILYCRVTVVASKRLLQTIRHLVSDKSFLMLLSALIDSILYRMTSCLNKTEIPSNITATRDRFVLNTTKMSPHLQHSPNVRNEHQNLQFFWDFCPALLEKRFETIRRTTWHWRRRHYGTSKRWKLSCSGTASLYRRLRSSAPQRRLPLSTPVRHTANSNTLIESMFTL